MTAITRALNDLGFDAFFQQHMADREGVPARVAAEHRGAYKVWSAQGQGMARLAGRLMQDLKAEAFPGVGDWVMLKAHPQRRSPGFLRFGLCSRLWLHISPNIPIGESPS